MTYVVSNPSSYAYLDATRPNADGSDFRAFTDGRNCTTYNQWPYGLERRTGGYTAKETDDQLKKQLAARPVTYLLGEIDILPLGGFDGSCPAMAQGPTRLARGQAFGKYVNQKFGAKHTITVVPLCGHNARCMFTAEPALPFCSRSSNAVHMSHDRNHSSRRVRARRPRRPLRFRRHHLPHPRRLDGHHGPHDGRNPCRARHRRKPRTTPRRVVEDFIWRLTGKETLYQMIALADQVTARGGTPLDPLSTSSSSWTASSPSPARASSNSATAVAAPDQYLVPGTRAMLEDLRARGLRLYLASGTDEPSQGGGRPARRHPLLRRRRLRRAGRSRGLLETHADRAHPRLPGMRPDQLLGFGDGPVEIEELKRAGGVAVGLATDEPECRVTSRGSAAT